MTSYETHILPNSDYYIYTPSAVAKNYTFIRSVPVPSVMKAVTA